jgi:RNA polymerase sigma factor (sigma-70 family)
LAGDAGKRQDKRWLEKLLAGDHEAFAEFVDEYKEMVFLCCRTIGIREHEIEDVASEAFMAAYKVIRRYRGQAKLSTWLWAIAYRKGMNCLRKNRREKLLFSGPDELLINRRTSGPQEGPDKKEESELVWQAVGRLPRLWALATILFYREEKEVKEIAKIMRIRQNTVKTYLFRGRKRLKELLAGAVGEAVDVGK